MTLQQRAACAAEAIAVLRELAKTLELSVLERRHVTMLEQHLDHAQSGLLSIKLQLASPPREGDAATDGCGAENFLDLLRRSC